MQFVWKIFFICFSVFSIIKTTEMEIDDLYQSSQLTQILESYETHLSRIFTEALRRNIIDQAIKEIINKLNPYEELNLDYLIQNLESNQSDKEKLAVQEHELKLYKFKLFLKPILGKLKEPKNTVDLQQNLLLLKNNLNTNQFGNVIRNINLALSYLNFPNELTNKILSHLYGDITFKKIAETNVCNNYNYISDLVFFNNELFFTRNFILSSWAFVDKVWCSISDEVSREFKDIHVSEFKISPDGSMLAFLTPNGLNIHSMIDYSLIKYYVVSALRFVWSPDSKRIAIVSKSDNEGGEFLVVNIYDVESNKFIKVFHIVAPLHKIDWHANDMLTISSHDNIIRVYNPLTVEIVQKFNLNASGHIDFAYSSDGSKLAVADKTVLKIFDLKPENLQKTIFQFDFKKDINNIAWSKDDQFISFETYKNVTSYIIDTTNGKVLKEITGKDVTWSRLDNKNIFAIIDDNNIEIYKQLNINYLEQVNELKKQC